MPFFTHGRLSMAVRLHGHGPLPLLAFHGFGRSGADMAALAPVLGARFTLHAFDLPFHGGSPAPQGPAPVQPEELAAFFTAYTASLGGGPAGLLGYSLGGRFALSLAERCPQLWSTVLLAAPDGLVRAPWYRALARHRLGRAAYRRFIRRPGAVHALIGLLHRTGLIGATMHQFLIGQSADRPARQLLHDVWTSFRAIEPDLRRVAANMREAQLPLHLFMGAHDRVIPPRRAQRLQRSAPRLVQVHVLPTGHWMLTPVLAAAILEALPHPGREAPFVAAERPGTPHP